MGGDFESVKDLEDFVNRHRPMGTPEIKYQKTNILNYIRERQKNSIMDGLSEGRIVHFVLDKTYKTESGLSGDRSRNEIITCRPAIIVNAWDSKLEDGMVNVQVLLDGSNDREALLKLKVENSIQVLANPITGINFLFWITSVKYSESKELGTWHWPERV
jgi:hypothetical protein